MLPSTFWIIMIAVGAVLVAISNINYNRVRETENRESKATQARALLYSEVQRNYQISNRLDAAVAKKTLPVETFDITAWQTVSASDLLLGLPDTELAVWLQTYGLINRANSLHATILDTMVGISSALGSAATNRDLFFTELTSIIKTVVEVPK